MKQIKKGGKEQIFVLTRMHTPEDRIVREIDRFKSGTFTYWRSGIDYDPSAIEKAHGIMLIVSGEDITPVPTMSNKLVYKLTNVTPAMKKELLKAKQKNLDIFVCLYGSPISDFVINSTELKSSDIFGNDFTLNLEIDDNSFRGSDSSRESFNEMIKRRQISSPSRVATSQLIHKSSDWNNDPDKRLLLL